MKNDYLIPTAAMCIFLGGIFGFLIGLGLNENKVIDYQKDVQLKCIYENRIQFNSELYSCTWLSDVTINDSQYERKPHPNKEVLK